MNKAGWADRRRLLLTAALLISPAARAQELDVAPPPNAPVHAGAQGAYGAYVSGPDCPAEAEFWAQVDAHRQHPSVLGALLVRAEVFQLGTRAQARVIFGTPRGVTASRELSASTCREAAAAAALVVALALDAHLDERKSAGEPPAPVARPAPPRAPAFPDAPAALRKEGGLYWQLGAGALVEQAIAPSPLLGGSAFAGLGEHEAAWDARLSFVFAQSGVTERDDASAEFSLLAAQLEGCAFHFVRSERFFVGPCLALQLGSVQSRGLDGERIRGEERASFWAAGGPLVRLRHAFSELWLELYAGPWVPLLGTREYVFLDPQGNRSFHEVGPVGVSAGLRIALHLE